MTQAPSHCPRPWRLRGLCASLLLLGAVAAVYANALTGEFQFDDYEGIVFNERIRDLGDLRAILLGGNRPVAVLVSAVNFHFSGESTLGYHLTNVGIHAVAALLVWQLLRLAAASARRREGAAPAVTEALCLGLALVWAVHPLNTMAVTYIIQGRMAALAGLFAVACVLTFGRFARTGRWPWALASLACLLLGAATKEHVVTLPLVLLAWDLLLVCRGNLRECLRARGAFHAAAFGLLAVLGGLFAYRYFGGLVQVYQGTTLVRNAADPATGITPAAYLLTQFGVVLRYLRLMVLPVGQSTEYAWVVATSLFSLRVLGPLALLLALGGAAAWLGRRNPLVALGALWFGLFLLVESSVIPLNDVIVEHRAYLPFVGVLLALLGIFLAAAESRVASRLVGTRRPARWVLGALVALAIPFGVAAHSRNEVWRTVLSFYEDAHRKYPEHPRVRANLMSAYVEQGRYADAMALYATLPEFYRQDPVVRFNAGVAYFETGRLRAALPLFESVQDHPYSDIRDRSRHYLRQIALGLAPSSGGSP